MNVLLDECVDWRLSRDITGHEVKTVGQMGWAGIQNGELLALAIRSSFNAFVTVDRNLSFQQNLPVMAIAVVVLHAPSNRLADLRNLVPKLLATLDSATPGTVVVVSEP